MTKHEEMVDKLMKAAMRTDLKQELREYINKLDELLELYRTQDKLLKIADVNIEVPTDEFVMWLNTTIKIKALEEEMK